MEALSLTFSMYQLSGVLIVSSLSDTPKSLILNLVVKCSAVSAPAKSKFNLLTVFDKHSDPSVGVNKRFDFQGRPFFELLVLMVALHICMLDFY